MVEGKDYLINLYTGEKWLIGSYHEGDVIFLYKDTKEYQGFHLWSDEEENVKYAKEVFGFDLK